MANIQKSQSFVDVVKKELYKQEVQEKLNNCWKENAQGFIISVLDVITNDRYLQQCDPRLVIQECLKAATLKLPIQRELGFAYVVAYNKKPTFILGYKGLIQLAFRTGQYKNLHADFVYEGEKVIKDRISGEIKIEGQKKSDKIIGYLAYFKLINGFEKAVFWTKEEVVAHAKKYSPSFNFKASAWQTEFDKMALKTVLKHLIDKYGPKSVEMIHAEEFEQEEEREEQEQVIDVQVEQQPEKQQETIPQPDF